VAIMLGLSVGVLAWTAPAAAADVRITAPKRDALRTSKVVRVVVKTTSPGLRVRMYGRGDRLRDVTRRFRRSGRGRYVARLRAGRALAYGRNTIFAAVRSGQADTRRFTVARRGRKRMALRRLEAGRAERPPLGVRVRAAGTTLRARLNGKDAREGFRAAGRGRWRAALTVRHGLRFGRNRLVVTVFDGGRFVRERRTFAVGRGRPLADAGRDRLARAGRAVRLDGSATRAARRAGLRLRWRIVSRPKGARARLTGARGKRPRLRASVNGRYRVALVARHARRGSARAAEAPRAAQAAPAAVDTVEIAVQPNALPSGVPVQTLASSDGRLGVSVGEDFYPMPAGAAVQLVELDRTTLDSSTAQNIGYEPGQEAALLTEVQSLTPDTIVIISGAGGPAYAAPAAVEQAIDSIGGLTEGYQAVGNLSELTNGHGGWSVIGIPELPPGQAYQLIGLQQAPGAAVGSMRGSFQLDSSGIDYVFNWAPEYHPFDTQASTTPTGNAMSVDGSTYTSWNLPFEGRTGTVGFQLLWFDADTLELRATQTYDADLNSSYDDPLNLSPGWEHGMWGLRNQLQQINADPKPGLLFINTIGTVPTLYFQATRNQSDGNDIRGDVMARVTALLEQFGANRFAFMGLGRGGGPGAQGGYSLVGVTGLRYLKGPNAAAELSTRLNPGTTPRLQGALKRSRQGVLQAGMTGSPQAGQDPTTVDPDMQRILAQQAQPFPRWNELPPGQQQAQREIASRLKTPMTVDTTTIGIRANYWLSPGLGWGGLAGQLDDMCLQPGSCSPTVAALAKQLSGEFYDVGAVWSIFPDGKQPGLLWSIYSDVFLSGGFNLDSIQTQIAGEYRLPKSSTSGPSALGILSGVLGITGTIGAFIPEGGEGIAAAADVAASVTDIIEASTTDSDSGEAKWDPYGYHSTVADVASDLDEAVRETQFGLQHLGELLVSDAGRLSAAADLAGTPTEAGGWQMSGAIQNQLKGRLLQSTRQFMWLTMMQPVRATYECAFEDQGGVTSHNPAAVLETNINYPEWRPRGKSAWNLYPTWIVLGNRNNFGWPDVERSDITEILFGNPNYDYGSAAKTDGAGFIREYLFERAIAGGGAPNPSNDYDRNIFPTSSGLVHKNMGMGTDDEDQNGLSHRNEWSAYTPSCGNGVRLIWSDPDPRQPSSPYANP
jgi:hypothetical protein